LTCNGGCTAATTNTGILSANSDGLANSVMTFADVFESVVLAGTLIEVDITGFTNPSTETVLNVYYEVIH